MRGIRLIVGVLIALGTASARADFPGANPFPGIEYTFEARTNPNLRLYVARIDLSHPNLTVRVAPGGEDPDGAGRYQTTLMRPSDIAQREGFDFVVNGDFFAVKGVEDAEGAQSRYASGQWAYVVGAAMSDGKRWSKGEPSRPAIVITRENKAVAAMSDAIPPHAREVISGIAFMVKNGVKPELKSEQIAPRTAVGFDKSGTKLIVLVVDGRSLTSGGMKYAQLADEMIRLGCETAINLDGGGSSSFVMRNAETGKWTVLNKPSDGRERAVANVLGVKVKPATAKPQIIGAAEWGSKPLPIGEQRRQIPKFITIHHAGVAWKAGSDPVEKIRNLQAWGQKEKGWPDLPYHFLIAPDGRIFEGRDVNYEPESNTKYELGGNIGIELMGNFEVQRVNLKQLRATAELTAWLCEKYSISPETIRGHRDVADTICPGRDLYRYISGGELRRWIGGGGSQLDLLKEAESGPKEMIEP